MLYGAQLGEMSKEIRGIGGELMQRFQKVYNEIKELLGPSKNPSPLEYLPYSYRTLWLHSWGL
jgi:hypothetical protein